jgi:outer membrane protein, multidrug efflux system
MVGPDYKTPDLKVPKHYKESTDLPIGGVEEAWWNRFNDKVLANLMQRVSSQNLDMQSAYARIRSARAEKQHTIATGLPDVSARAVLSQRDNLFVNGQNADSPVSGGYFGDSLLNIAQEGLSVQWEIDPAGGLFRRIERAQAEIDAKQYDRRALLVSLQGEIARVYIELRANQEKLALTSEAIRKFGDTHELLKARATAGLDNWETVSQQKELLSTTESLAPALEKLIKQQVHQLSVLLGAYPADLSYIADSVASIPTPSEHITIDLPAELIRRRPDIMASESQLAAASADQGAAMALQYPKINLSSFIGAQNTQLASLIPMGKAWSYGGGISMPVFNWGRIQADIDRAQALYDERYFDYKQTVLTAYKEVEDFLIGYRKELERKSKILAAVDASQDALYISEDRYLLGLTPFISLLQNQSNNYKEKLALIENKMLISSSVVGLYKALGGGWKVSEPSTSHASP